jgi:hypothetical protein
MLCRAICSCLLLAGLAPALPAQEANRIATLWQMLGDEDGAVAYRALWDLVEHGDGAVAFLRARLDEVPRLASEKSRRLRQLLADLDSDEFDVRDSASTELARLGIDAGDAIEKSLRGASSPEAKKRLGQLFALLPERRDLPPAAIVQQLRAVEVLERIATPAARDLLRHLATGPSDDRICCDACRAVQRLEHRPR